jgi:flagellar basal-body rod protein FlgB
VVPIYLFQLAAQGAQWLSSRQALIAGNVANSNTPGYHALDLRPFSAVLEATQGGMARTNPAHMGPAAGSPGDARASESDSANATISGNSVNLEQQMMTLGEIARGYSMNANLRRAFHQMLMASVK